MSDPHPDLWAGVFQRQCKARLRRRTAQAWEMARWGRCELRAGHPGDHALDFGMWVVMFGGDPFRVYLEPTWVLIRLLADKLHGKDRW
jgi:hypothetical protein